MTKRDRESLTYFAAAGLEASVLPPKGLGPVGISNFSQRKWIERFGRDGKTGEMLYRITRAGMDAYLKDRDA